ncbi:MAG: hypothetical protein M1838_001737 [Thelocarpon superellum]|nr:MAG: hypothetical protein M1838_001737 [Thelocarpon superellum]
MSATPPGPPSGRTPNGGGPPMFIRRQKNSDPLVRPKKTVVRPKTAPQSSAMSRIRSEGNGSATAAGKSSAQPSKTRPTATANGATPPTEQRGFSGPVPTVPYDDYDLVITKRALMEGLRYHVARFASKKAVDPSNEQEFTRPVRLQRRDPRAPPAGLGGMKVDPADADSKEELLDEKERERQEILRQEKEAQRQADLEQIAPRGNQFGGAGGGGGGGGGGGVGGGGKKQYGHNKKTTQVYDHDQTPEAQKRSKVRYEEALPWHLEDFDNKNTWVGNYESALSDMYVSLVAHPGQFRMMPLERWYKFTPRNHFKTLTIEEAESRMSKAMKEPRWIMDQQHQQAQQAQQEAENRRGGRKLFLGKWENERSGRGGAMATKTDPDADDLDYVEEVQDDEGPQLIEGEEEEAKEAEERIKRDQLQANIFDLKEEKLYDMEDAEEKKQAELAKKLGKGVKKALIDREKNYIYDSDSDANPYSAESDSDGSDEEKRKEEERKKAEEKTDKGKNKEGIKVPSGASSKGNNTPAGRAKFTDSLKRSTASLKRPGSPDLSETSGTETTRKRPKKKHGSSQPTGTSTPKGESGPHSPVPSSSAPDLGRALPRKSSVIRLSVDSSKLSEISAAAPKPNLRRPAVGGAGSGSDGEATGGEMSEGGRHKKIKLRLNSKGSPLSGSPPGSRAGSPNPVGGRQGSNAGAGSRAGSPTGGSPPPANLTPITEAEIVASIPAKGMTIAELIAKLGKARAALCPTGAFSAMVKKHAVMGPGRVLMPRTAASST